MLHAFITLSFPSFFSLLQYIFQHTWSTNQHCKYWQERMEENGTSCWWRFSTFFLLSWARAFLNELSMNFFIYLHHYFFFYFTLIRIKYLFFLYKCWLCVPFAVRPLLMTINGADKPLSAGRHYDLECVAAGSRPAANIHWYIHEVQQAAKDRVSSQRETQLYCLHISLFACQLISVGGVCRRNRRNWHKIC